MRLPLKFYTDLDFRQQNQVDTYSGDFQRYICTPFRLIPFQIRRDHSINAINEFKLVNVATLAETDLLTIGGIVEINYGAVYDWLIYYADVDFAPPLDTGNYYIVINDTINTWYSDNIDVCILDYYNQILTLEWWNDCDICNILYQTGFQNKIYLNTDVFAPEYKFYEDAEEDDERNIIAYNQIAHKYYKFEIVGSKALCNSFSIIHQHDNIKLTFPNGETYDVLDFTPDFDAIKDCYGAMQQIECTFRIDSCEKSDCCNNEEINKIALAGTFNGGKILRSIDYGATWADLGRQGTEIAIRSLIYLEDGIALAGTGNSGKIFRSTDKGATWVDLGQQFGESSIYSLAYCSNGIALAGTRLGGKILRSIDYGATWADLGQQFGETSIWSLVYLEDGIVVAGTSLGGKILRSIDYGATWVDLGQQFGEFYIYSLAYCSNGIALAGTSPSGKILRSIDYGATWVDLGQQFLQTSIYFLAYLENGIALAGTSLGGKILRSIDYGATWADLGQQFGEIQINSLAYLRDGITLAGTGNNGKILRSIDYGATWADLGQQFAQTIIFSLAYLD